MPHNCHSDQPPVLLPRYNNSIISLSKERVIYLSEDVTAETCNSLAALLVYYDHLNQDPIELHINTYGGSVPAMLSIHNIINMIKAPVKTMCIGKAYSAGAFILSSGNKGMRCATENSSIMIHGIQSAFPVEESLSKSKIYFEYLCRINNIVIELLAKNVNKSIEEVKKDCAKDYFMDAEEALAYGIIDQII